MRTILLAATILILTSVAGAQEVKPLPTVTQCEHDSSVWIDSLNTPAGFKVLKTLSFNDLTDRAHEMDECRFQVIPKFDIAKVSAETCWGNGHKGCTEKEIADLDMLYAIHLEDWINYERLSWAYQGEALYRAGIFIHENQLDERFWQFNSGYTKANQ